MWCGCFSADIRIPGAAEVAAVRSPFAHALIRSIDYAEAKKMPGVIGVLTAKDIKGTNRIKLSIEDRPLFCEDKVSQSAILLLPLLPKDESKLLLQRMP